MNNYIKMKIYDVLKSKYFASKENNAELVDISLRYGPCFENIQIVKKEGWMKYTPIIKQYKKKINVIKLSKNIDYVGMDRYTEYEWLSNLTRNKAYNLQMCIRAFDRLKNNGYIISSSEGMIYPTAISKFICLALKEKIPKLYNGQLYLRIKEIIDSIKKTGKAKNVPFSYIYNSLFGKRPLDKYDINVKSHAVYIGKSVADILYNKIIEAKLYICYRVCPLCNKYRKVETRVINEESIQKVRCIKCGTQFNY